ncbi:class I tRNA ligase family protein, partial [bacterium]|nr:class I tRNA ligase family protein [bacterium]
GIKHSIVEWDQVDSQSGAGVVHIAPGCGAEDFELGKKLGADIISPLDQSGHFVEGFGSLDGKYAHDVADEVIQQLKDMGMLYKEEEYKHSYPHCWRCKTKCLFRLENNWYLNVRAIKEDLIKATETVTWKPDFAKKRMLAWLNNMEDWMISRKRFYGLALPFYVCPKCGHLHVVGGLEELKELAVNPEQVDKLESVHRPWIDEIEIKCPECGANVKRITDVGDCWLDAGVVPFSTLHYLDDKKYWEKWYPAEFVTEMIEQVRLWFYAILVFGVVLEDRAPYSTVLCSAELRDEHNQKMSKTGNNSIDFYDAADKVGSDLVRWTYSTASVGANMRFGWSIIEDVRRRFYIPLWNSYNYFVTYSILHNFDLSTYDVTKLTNVMDKWIVAKTKQLGIHIASYLDNYDMASSAREAEEYVKDLSQWYIRRSRNRFKNGDTDALGTLHFCLLSISKILAPFMPFVTEEMYQNLAVNMDTENHKESVHLEDYPTYTLDKEETDLLDNMTTIRNICSNGLKARENAKMSLRQPLSIAYVGTKDTISQDIIREELNVEKIEYAEKPVEGDGIYTVGEKEMFVSIDANLTEELKNAGIISTFLRKYKDLRKKKGLKMGDIVSLNIHTETEELKDVLQNYSESNTEELQAKDVTIDTDLDKGGEEIDVCGNKIKVEIY